MEKYDEVISTPGSEFDISFKKEEKGFGLFEMQGARPSQEDAAIARWYSDKSFVSLTPQEIGRRLWTTYKLLNQHQLNLGGATASTTVYDGDNHLITATIGDSVAFAVSYALDGTIYAVTRLNQKIDHPEEDKERLNTVGAFVIYGRLQGREGSLALSRAIGDEEYRAFGICDDAHIDVHSVSEFFSAKISKLQVIVTCDGFTEPVSLQTKYSQEKWLLRCLKNIPQAGSLTESELAKLLALEAFNYHSQDNISVLVQTVTQSQPFLIGVYDGHNGKEVSTYLAQNIGHVFDQQCQLSPKNYARQRLSADRYFEIYYRDNKDESFYQMLVTEKKARLDELSKAGGVHEKLRYLSGRKDQFVDEVVQAGEEIGPIMQALLAIEDVRAFIEALCIRYVDLEIDKNDLAVCLEYVLYNKETFVFEPESYKFLPFDFIRHKESADYLKANHGLTKMFHELVAEFIMPAVAGDGLAQYSVFKPEVDDTQHQNEDDINLPPPV